MRINKQYLTEAQSILSRRREENRSVSERRREEILRAVPEYGETERLLAENMRKVLLNASVSENETAVLLEENRRLNDRLSDILIQRGYPEGFLDDIYSCPKCKDTGNTGSEWCECLCRLSNELAAKRLNQNAPLERSRFDNFSLESYSEEAKEGKPSPRRIMTSNLQFCREFAESFSGSGSGIFMMGNTGLGKTHLSLAIAGELLEKGFCVVYGSVPELVRTVRGEQFGESEGDTMQLALDCDLLILDDLGAENSTDWSVSTLYEIINTRQNRSLPIIISSNLPPDELARIYTDRLFSRIFSMKRMIFDGNDNRVWAADA